MNEQNRINEKSIFSIVTPVYNSYNLMDRYFKSLEDQKKKNFEVIIIDDCSEDDSYNMLCEYASKSELNIKVYKTEENSGPGEARNIGIKEARGEWITFIDNDDWIDEGFFETINDVIDKNDVDALIYDYYITNGKKSKSCSSMYTGNEGYVEKSHCIKYVRNHTIGKVYKLKNLLDNNIQYPKMRRCEDIVFVTRALTSCNNIYYKKESLYYYYQRLNSLSNSNELDESDLIKAYEIISEEYVDSYYNEIKEKSVVDILYGCLLIMCKNNKSNTEISDFITRYEKYNYHWYSMDILNYIGRSKLLFLNFVKNRNIFLMRLYSKMHKLALVIL